MKLLSFDIEISNIFEPGKHEDMEKYAPFDISVAATAVHGGEERVWFGGSAARTKAWSLRRRCAGARAAGLAGQNQDS